MDYEYTKDHILSIRLMPDGFSFSIQEPIETKTLFYCSATATEVDYIQTIEDVLEEHPMLLHPFAKTYVILANKEYIHLPVNDAIQHYQQAFELVHHKLTQEYQILVDKGTLSPLVTVHTISQKLASFLQRTFTPSQLLHHTTILSSYFSHKGRLGNFDKLILLTHQQKMDFVVIKKGKIQLINSYPLQNTCDAVYYLLSTWQKVGLDNQYDYLQYYGDRGLIEPILEQIKPYIKNISPLVLNKESTALNGSDTAPFDLINLPLCV